MSSKSVSSSIPSWQILTAHAQPFRGARHLAFCLKVPLDSLLEWASSGGSGQTARMRRLAWTFAARIGDKYQILVLESIVPAEFVKMKKTTKDKLLSTRMSEDLVSNDLACSSMLSIYLSIFHYVLTSMEEESQCNSLQYCRELSC